MEDEKDDVLRVLKSKLSLGRTKRPSLAKEVEEDEDEDEAVKGVEDLADMVVEF